MSHCDEFDPVSPLFSDSMILRMIVSELVLSSLGMLEVMSVLVMSELMKSAF